MSDFYNKVKMSDIYSVDEEYIQMLNDQKLPWWQFCQKCYVPMSTENLDNMISKNSDIRYAWQMENDFLNQLQKDRILRNIFEVAFGEAEAEEPDVVAKKGPIFDSMIMTIQRAFRARFFLLLRIRNAIKEEALELMKDSEGNGWFVFENLTAALDREMLNFATVVEKFLVFGRGEEDQFRVLYSNVWKEIPKFKEWKESIVEEATELERSKHVKWEEAKATMKKPPTTEIPSPPPPPLFSQMSDSFPTQVSDIGTPVIKEPASKKSRKEE